MTKFDTPLAEKLYGEMPDDESGSVQELGWYGRYDSELVILNEDSDGFVNTFEAIDKADLDRFWSLVTKEYELYYSIS